MPLLSIKADLAEHLGFKALDINTALPGGELPLYYAIDHLHDIETIRLLLDNGAGVNFKAANHFGRTPFIIATINNRQDIMSLLLEYNADINATDDNGWTALMLAACFKREDLVKFLLSRGVNIHIQDHQGLSAISMSEMPSMLEHQEPIRHAIYRLLLAYLAPKVPEPILSSQSATQLIPADSKEFPIEDEPESKKKCGSCKNSMRKRIFLRAI